MKGHAAHARPPDSGGASSSLQYGSSWNAHRRTLS